MIVRRERHRTGFAFWVWKENRSGSWGMFDSQTGCLRPARERLLARVYPVASSDANLTYHYDPDTGGFTLAASGNAAAPATVVYIPPKVRGSVAASGTPPACDRDPARRQPPRDRNTVRRTFLDHGGAGPAGPGRVWLTFSK